MLDEFALFKKLKSSDCTIINGIDSYQFACLLELQPQNTLPKNSVFVFNGLDDADYAYKQLKNKFNILFFPERDLNLYSSIVPDQIIIEEQIVKLNELLTNDHDFIFCTLPTFIQKFPPISYFKQGNLTISIDDIIKQDDLAQKLIELGYQSSVSVEEPGCFSKRGEIFDIYPLSGNPVRLIFFDDLVEDIFYIDKNTNKTKRDEKIQSLTLQSSTTSLLHNDSKLKFKESFPRPKHNQQNLYKTRQKIFEFINNNISFPDLSFYLPYFFNEMIPLYTYMDNCKFYFFNSIDQVNNLETFITKISQEYEQLLDDDENRLKPNPISFFDLNFKFTSLPHIQINPIEINIAEDDFSNKLDIKLDSFFLKGSLNQKSEMIFRKIRSLKNYNIYVFYTDSKFINEIKFLFESHFPEYDLSRLIFKNQLLKSGFVYQNENLICLSQNDFFVEKAKRFSKKERSSQDLFADQLATLEAGDYLIHKEHGVGIFLGIEPLNLNNSTTDFIVIEYKDKDKVYVPVYKMSQVQKYANSSTAVPLANLKTKKFEQVKQRAAQSIKRLAFDLLELHAKQKLKESHAFTCPEHELDEFELSFKFEETPDQKSAIEDVLTDLKKKQPMDRLVCGDVGFGKTEVAMRAAYAAVLDSKQVCVLVPTTVLALQHYNSFTERFKDFPVRVDFISRFRTAKQSKEIIDDLTEGKIDIIIGTHKLLSDSVKFKDLGLIIIDEEQRFGVAHKEKLKLFRESVDTLMLTATPIPRTLQLSFLGIKDLSIIKTPPPKRQSIKTYLIKEDPQTLKLALEKELNRNGQIFVVHNKVSDIEIFTDKIRKLVPKAKIIYAHGQLSEKELEKRITAFYKHEYDILIATTIIESGIDIPNANTMIIDRADTYGLSQLHQLRGRIGRSDKKAYAYFTIPKDYNLTEIAAKRLRAITQFSEIGSGFSLATSDLEIRGSGDILGPEQSGHINNIGLELYMELLEETINQLKGQVQTHFNELEIITPYASFIPKDYIEDSATRLKYYKKLSNARSLSSLENYREEILDFFGTIPIEVENLISILKIRIILQKTGIDKINCGPHSVILFFNEKALNESVALRDKILEIFMKRPKIYKINPDFSINCKFKDRIKINDLIEFANFIAEQIIGNN